ncbi:MAG TPA: RagB/SusD family nutrient uptake outer membrane protein [Balneolales bacterium]|nr:RagB/SusD family nutrient uptake outer membrane protein [Balneolales bacterium]
MKFRRFRLLALLLVIPVFGLIFSSCTGDLNTNPIDKKVVTTANAYQTPADYKAVLAKLYAGFATTGQQGPAGEPDIQGIDEGFSSYIRQYFVCQELPTDEAVVAWNDPGLPQFNFQSWGASNDFVMGMYDRIYYEIAMTNEFIRNAAKSSNSQVQGYLAEARFLRALSYWHAIDMFGGNVPFVNEKDGVGAYLPKPIGKDSLFNYVEGELLAIQDQLPAPKQNEYGRADQGAVWTLLAKLYLNAGVYTGKTRYNDVVTYTKKVIDSGAYSLDPSYQHLFQADNNTAKGVIFSINFDGTHTQTYGGTNYIIHAAVGGSMDPSAFGIDGGWGGNRVTPEFVGHFDMQNDARAMFYTDGQTEDIKDIHDFKNGYAVTKWTNMTSTGAKGSNPSYADTDFPMFRLADVYLMYAEATLRGNSGNIQTAVNLVNKIRERAYGDNSGDITQNQLTLQFILNERARELYWEGYRRTDLIRFGEYTGSNYLWSWKGNVQQGRATDSHYNLYPIPTSDITSNPNLTQNPGY